MMLLHFSSWFQAKWLVARERLTAERTAPGQACGHSTVVRHAYMSAPAFKACCLHLLQGGSGEGCCSAHQHPEGLISLTYWRPWALIALPASSQQLTHTEHSQEPTPISSRSCQPWSALGAVCNRQRRAAATKWLRQLCGVQAKCPERDAAGHQRCRSCCSLH
jgi:hypothetical protein